MIIDDAARQVTANETRFIIGRNRAELEHRVIISIRAPLFSVINID